MNKVLKFGLLVSAFVVGFSCKKEMKKTVIDGIVRDEVTKQPLEGVEVYLQMGKFVDDNHPYENPQTFQSFITGSDGKFHTEFRAQKHYTYGLEYQKPSQCYFDTDNGQKINTGKTNNIDISLISWNTLNIHLKNVSPYDSNDQICFYLSKSATGCTTPPYIGMSLDLIHNVQVKANSRIYIKSFITKNSITTVRLDSVDITPCIIQAFDLFY